MAQPDETPPRGGPEAALPPPGTGGPEGTPPPPGPSGPGAAPPPGAGGPEAALPPPRTSGPETGAQGPLDPEELRRRFDERPELGVAVVFAGGFLLAQLLKAIGR